MLLQTIPLAWAEKHCVGVVRACGSADAILQQSLIERTFGDGRDQIAFDQLGLLYLNTARAIADDASGLGLRRVPRGTATLAAHVMLGCGTLDYALTTVSRLYGTSTIRYGLKLGADDALIVVQSEDAESPSAFALEELYAVFLFGAASLFLGRPLPLRIFQTRDPTHPHLNGRHWATFAPVCFAKTAGLRVPRSILAARRVGQGSDQIHWDMIEPWLAAAEGQAALAAQKFVAIGDLRLDALAAEAGVSVSTLRRDMSRTHGGFRQVRQNLVLDAGLNLLHHSGRSTEAIAELLGYADARSFRRFIKSATGHTPEALRAAPFSARPPARAVRDRIREAALAQSR